MEAPVILSRKGIKKLHQAAQLPSLFEKSQRTFWTERYVSKHILNAHLDPSSDDASRKPGFIKKSAAWISAQVGGGAGRRLIDLGCGPGLYCTEFNNLGFEVTGVDFSRNSITHARKTALKEGHQITYKNEDYVSTELPRGFDVVTLIYGDFCVLSNSDRDLLLWKIRSVLNPGGYLFLDVFTKSYQESRHLKTDWYFQVKSGFWHPRPHLVLEQSHDFPDSDTCLNQYIVLAPWQRPRKYHIWHHHYTKETITKVLKHHKFKVAGTYADLAGSPFDAEGEWIGLMCRRED
jgi:2-polyprenyl-3-methyl-5-hydroxy-6-metoxy-1,4-benzoquinol methylase